MSDDWRHRLHDYRDPGRLVLVLTWMLAFEGISAAALVSVQLQTLSPTFGAMPIEVSALAQIIGVAQLTQEEAPPLRAS